MPKPLPGGVEGDQRRQDQRGGTPSRRGGLGDPEAVGAHGLAAPVDGEAQVPAVDDGHGDGDFPLPANVDQWGEIHLAVAHQVDANGVAVSEASGERVRDCAGVRCLFGGR